MPSAKFAMVATTRNERHLQTMKQIGVDHVVHYSMDDLPDSLEELTDIRDRYASFELTWAIAVGMNVKLLSQIAQRPLTPDGGQSNLRLEGRCVVPARSSAHRLSCSEAILGSQSGRKSTYRLVQISRASSQAQPLDLARKVMRRLSDGN